MKNKEDEILNKQVEEAEEKALKLFEEQERRRQQLKDQIEKSRALQIQKKRDERGRDGKLSTAKSILKGQEKNDNFFDARFMKTKEEKAAIKKAEEEKQKFK